MLLLPHLGFVTEILRYYTRLYLIVSWILLSSEFRYFVTYIQHYAFVIINVIIIIIIIIVVIKSMENQYAVQLLKNICAHYPFLRSSSRTYDCPRFSGGYLPFLVAHWIIRWSTVYLVYVFGTVQSVIAGNVLYNQGTLSAIVICLGEGKFYPDVQENLNQRTSVRF